ncbi:MAG: S8 family serine peptidase [Lachnospiraceae bacterium]|nr:S8 family serine peptidase [Lachnospiraceae bacterium]
MAFLNKITAIGLGVSLMFGMLPLTKASAAEQKEPMTFDYHIGESVTYYTQDNKVSSVDTYKSSQWALENDGSFTDKSGLNNSDYYGTGPWDGYPGGNWGRGWYWGFGSKGWSAIEQSSAVEDIDINMDEAREIYSSKSSAKEVVVALIDTGVDYTHEDLADSIWVNEDEIPNNGIDDDKNGFIDDVYGWNFYDNSNKVYTGSSDEHGTHCAGTIAAKTDNGVGIASVTGGTNVKVMVLKALGGSEGTGETISIIQAIRYAEANGASIVNLSLGSYYSDELLYNTIASSSMLFVVASGNGDYYTGRGSNNDTTPCYPASYDLDNIISVANISYDGTLDSSSNYGARSVDLAAPGTSIISTVPGNKYEYLTGTSMSAPFVTAAAALVYSYYENITLSDVKEILLNSVKKLDSLSGKTVSGGMLDVSAALSYNTSKLSHKKFVSLAATGSAPEFSYEVYTQNNKLYISINVIDADRDLYALYYADGKLSAADFAYGLNGKSFTLRNSSASFVSTDYGTYTFYALDSAGHETVLTINLSEEKIEERATDNTQYYERPGRRNSMPRRPF